MADEANNNGASGGNGANGANGAAAEAAKAPAKKTEYFAVTMTDGRVVQFPGNRQADKTIEVNVEAGTVSVRWDFRNGETRMISSTELDPETKLRALGHGLSQKGGDEYSGEKLVDDMVIALDDVLERVRKGEWTQAKGAGDSFSGASLVIKAICEVTGKSMDAVKAFLSGKLEAAKAKGEKLTRADLYASFKNPESKTGAVIERLEREQRAKSSKMDANTLLSEIGEEALGTTAPAEGEGAPA